MTDPEGKVVAQSRSNQDGTFRIPLFPGSYILVPEAPNAGAPPAASPAPFEVVEGSWTQVTITYDSGIR